MRSLVLTRRHASIPAAALALAAAGCGGSASTGAPPSVTAATPAPAHSTTPPTSAGLQGNGRTSQAGSICQGFVAHANLQLHVGVTRIAPQAGPQLYALLEGLSRRLSFLSGPADRRARIKRFADQLDRAATTAQAMARQGTTSPGGRQRFEAIRASLAWELRRGNAQATALGLKACVINLNGQRPPH